MSRQLIALALAASLLGLAGPAFAADEQSHETPQPPRQKWTFYGPFGHYDKGQLQRGLKTRGPGDSGLHNITTGTTGSAYSDK